MKKLSERSMSAREKRIPQLAEDAVKQARNKALKAGRKVVEALDGQLIESYPDGTRKVLKPLPAPIPVTPEQRLTRRKK